MRSPSTGSSFICGFKPSVRASVHPVLHGNPRRRGAKLPDAERRIQLRVAVATRMICSSGGNCRSISSRIDGLVFCRQSIWHHAFFKFEMRQIKRRTIKCAIIVRTLIHCFIHCDWWASAVTQETLILSSVSSDTQKKTTYNKLQSCSCNICFINDTF